MSIRKVRDSQRQRVYDAERIVKDDASRGDCHEMLSEVEDVQRFVKKVLKSSWTKRHFPKIKTVIVKDGRRRRSACAIYYGGERGYICMPRWSRSVLYTVHELSHIFADSVYGKDGVPAHGREFCGTYVKVVQHFIGKEAADMLKNVFRNSGVKYKQKRQRILTDEQKAVLRERGLKLAAARKEKLQANG